jgi:hypothetical protein
LLLGIWLAVPATATTSYSSANHPVSVVEADVYVNRAKTIARLKCFAEDLELLQGVAANPDGLYDSEELREATQDHAKYLAERFELIDAKGKKLPAKVIEIVDFDIPAEGIRAGTLMNYQMGFVLEFDYDSPPEFLTINQRMVAEGQLLPSELKILLKQAGSDTPYVHMMKPNQPETFRFDWDKPALSSDASEKEWAEWFNEQREKTLGITSYSSVYSFIYITNFEVRHEVLIPLATLAAMIDMERADEAYLEIAEQDAARQKIEALFSVGNEVEIDSVVVKPVFDRVDFYGLDLSDFAMQAERRKISMANGRVGVIMVYSTKGPPSDVKVTWDKFNPAMRTVDSVVFAYDKVEKTEFTMFLENNTYHWTAPDRPPLPPITSVASTLDPKLFVQPKISIPLVTVGLGIFALLSLAGNLVIKGRWSIALSAAGILGAGAIIAWPVAHYEIRNPFVAKPVFKIPDEVAGEVFAQLHKNMFRAFDYSQESDIYDALANSVQGDLLRSLYLDINESLKVKEQGGAVSHIDEVRIVEGKQIDLPATATPGADEPPAFGYRCKWDLVGTVEHWGHIHQRTTRYDAEFQIQLCDDAWKITRMQVVDFVPGQVKTSLRKF